ncbi:hypothetical protein [Spirosoma sp. KNUC1025]|uniref:hypothetical protein n=1 Tax=Spirosoma sp. KNUC1025 TaxID=2894082 RepID=UPI00386FF7C9|nr:hypothetical protein LN737_05145 [Spirosoma sp. KNUC1025]
MLSTPQLPFTATAREWVDFCLSLQTEAGFIALFEAKWNELGGQKKHMVTAYEAAEQLYESLLGRGRRYKNRDVFFSARWRFYSKQ